MYLDEHKSRENAQKLVYVCEKREYFLCDMHMLFQPLGLITYSLYTAALRVHLWTL